MPVGERQAGEDWRKTEIDYFDLKRRTSMKIRHALLSGA